MTSAAAVSGLVVFLTLAAIGSVIYFFLTGGANEKFSEFPVAVSSHALFGAVYLLMAPLQFSQTIRKRSLNFHRWSGRVLVVLALMSGVGALFLGIIIPYSGTSEQIIIGFFGSLFLCSLVLSYTNIRRKNVQLHREWMIRALALGLSIATMRLIFVPVLILSALDREATEAWSIISFTIAFILHCGFAEFWIRRTRKIN
ncbi:MAG: DUF2306 domain-containing protein [Pseudohongiellaceae bacterium]